MAGPITWRNVEGPSIRDAALLFRGASDQINTGLAGFSNIIKESEDIQAANVRATQEVGKQNYLDMLQSAKTPEELAALEASGQAEALRASLGAAGRNATRGAVEARTTSLRAGVTAETAFNNAQLAEKEKPYLAELNALAFKDPAAAAAKAAEYRAQGLIRDETPILKDAQSTQRSNAEYGRKELGWTRADQDRDRQVNVLQPAEDAARAMSVKRAGIEMTELERSTAEKADARAVDEKLAKKAAEHTASVRGSHAAIAENAKKFGTGEGIFKLSEAIPMREDGTVNYGKMKDEDYAKYDLWLKQNGQPTMTGVQEADTKAFAATMEEARQSGVSGTNLARISKDGQTLFSTSRPTPIGAHADLVARQAREVEAADQRLKDQYGQIGTQGAKDELMEVGKKFLASKPGGFNGKERWERGLAEWINRTGGIEVDKTTGERVYPSPAKFQAILSEMDTDFNWFSTMDDVQDALKKGWDKNQEAQIGAKKLAGAKLQNSLREVQGTKSGK